jgi:hypothetical protein
MVPLMLWVVCPSAVVARVAKNNAANISLIFVIMFLLPKRSILTGAPLEKPPLPTFKRRPYFFSSQYELLCDTETFERMLLTPERAVKRKMELCSLGSPRRAGREKPFAKFAGRRRSDAQY